MKKIIILMTCIFLMKSLFASDSVENVTFCAKKQINLKTGRPTSGFNSDQSAFLKSKQLFSGEIRILTVNQETLDMTLIKIPTNLKTERKGLVAIAREARGMDDCMLSFTIYNNAGKNIDSIFGIYKGTSLGAAAMFNIGAKLIVNERNHFIASVDSLLVGAGVALFPYTRFELRPSERDLNVEIVNRRDGTTTIVDRREVLNRFLD